MCIRDRVETDRFQPLQGGALGQRLIGVAVAQRAVRVGPVLGGTTVRYDRIGVGADPLRPAAVTDRIRGAGGIVSGARLGPGRVSAQAGACSRGDTNLSSRSARAAPATPGSMSPNGAHCAEPKALIGARSPEQA